MSLLTIVLSSYKLQSNFEDSMSGQQRPGIITHFQN